MLPETIEKAKEIVESTSDEVAPLLDPFWRAFYFACKQIAEANT